MSISDDVLVEEIARAIYCDGTYPLGCLGATAERWAKTSEVQREFCRQQARSALRVMKERLPWTKP